MLRFRRDLCRQVFRYLRRHGKFQGENVAATGAEFVTAIDPSCLLHLQGILGKRKAPTHTIHLASILAQEELEAGRSMGRRNREPLRHNASCRTLP